MSELKIVTLQESNYRQAEPTLRAIADAIEAGEYGEVGCVGVVLMGNKLEVFGAGLDAEGPSVALLLHAGFLKLSMSLVDHGDE